MTDMAISPVQSQGITSNDVAMTAGAAALGALGGGAMYFKTPSEDAFVKSGVKIENKALAEQAETLTNALKEANELDAFKKAAKETLDKADAAGKAAAQEALDAANTKTLSNETKEALGKLGLADDAKNATGITNKLKETVSNISDEKAFTKAKNAANEVLAEGSKFADDAKATSKDTLEGTVKKLFNDAKDNIKKEADKLDNDAKKGVEILKKAKMSAALKWGAISAAALAVLTAGYLYFTKGNNAEQAKVNEEV